MERFEAITKSYSNWDERQLKFQESQIMYQSTDVQVGNNNRMQKKNGGDGMGTDQRVGKPS